MKTEKFPTDTASASAVETGVRRAFNRRALAATALIPLISTAGAVSGWYLAPAFGMTPQLATGIFCAVSGFVSAGFVGRHLSSKLAPMAAESMEAIASYIELSGEDVLQHLNCVSVEPDATQLDADMALLKQRFALASARTRDAMAELEHAREQADLQNVAKSQFLANMSHELRTPLNAVLGYAMLLHEDAAAAGNTTAMTDLDRIQVAGRHLLSLINDLLDLSKIETGKTTVERTVFNISTFVEELTTDFSRQEAREGNAFEKTIASDLGVMIGDEIKLRQCITSILANAFKFTSNGTVKLDVRLRDSGASSFVAFSVSDTGVGFDQSRAEELFESFSQADTSSSRRFGGSGLGLAITRRLVRLMGGDVEVESVVGQGSTFRVVVPVNPSSGAPKYNHVPPGSDEDAPETASIRYNGDRKTALVIDDNEAALDLMRRWLTRLDYQVVAVMNGELGLIEARNQKFDLIILDVLLPGQSGYDVLAELRDDENMDDTPIILVTVEDDRSRGLSAGATEYIRKPVGEEQLRSMLEVYQAPVKGDVLVIEDDDDAAELVRRCAEQVGFAVRHAVDGAEGLEMARAQRPSAIVLDLAMPRFDGFSVIEELRVDPHLSDVPVIILSAREISLEDHQRIADAGYRFCAKGSLSPREIAAQLKGMIA